MELILLVGTGRFELPTPRTPSECSTRLSHVPTQDLRCRAASGAHPFYLTAISDLASQRRLAAIFLFRISPAGLWLHGRKLQLALHAIDAIKEHPHPVADRVLLLAALADDLPRILAIGVAVVGERGQGH